MKGDAALQHAIEGAERAMQALRLASDATEKARLSMRATRLLAEAESIKSHQHSPSERHNPRNEPQHTLVNPGLPPSNGRAPLKAPCSTRHLSKGEQILLLRSSYLHGFKFPPWTTPPEESEFELKHGEDLFLDTKDLPLSDFQEDVLDGWKRPEQALPPPSWTINSADTPELLIKATRRIDLVQDAATDCSVVASLCASIARLDRGHADIVAAASYPRDIQTDSPVLSRNGRYVFRLNFNGTFRKVVIDDRLPTSSTIRTIHLVDRNNPGHIWPPLLEKAYLKVRGGYDFPGSNSGTDLWIISGWIPEQIFLQCDDFESNQFWKRIFDAFNFGDVLITMGTGKMSGVTERELGLAGEHDYAVLDLREVHEQRLFLIKNPWSEGTSWRGKRKDAHADHVSKDGHAPGGLEVESEDTDAEPVLNPRDLLNCDEQLSPGTFWMDLDNVLRHFESIYLNWNPGLFTCRQDVHFSWDLSSTESGKIHSRGRHASLSRHPQYTITTATGGPVWILLWRHFQNAVPADATLEEIEDDRYGIELKGHISLLAFLSNGHRVLLQDMAVEKGWYVDSPQTLLKFGTLPGQTYTIVPTEQELPATKHTFTISAFSSSPVTLAEAKTKYEYAASVAGAWTKDTAGGNAHSPVYSTNPQYSLVVPRKTTVSLLLETANTELNMHIKLLHSQGQRVHSLRNRDIICDSKDYRRGCCVAEHADLDAGQYTIICSTFEPDQLGVFNVTVESTHATQIVPLPREGAGRIRIRLGDVVFRQRQNKVIAPLMSRRLIKIYAMARRARSAHMNETVTQQSTASPTSLIRLSFETGRGPNRRTLGVSNEGDYSNCAGAVRTNDIDLLSEPRRASEIWVCLERMPASSEQREERFSVELFVDWPDAVSCGDWQVFDDD